MTPQTVSVVVCTYNRAESLNETLRALAAQQLGEGVALEVIVVDNNSADHTARVVDAARRNGGRAIRYVHEPRQGLSHARNHGIQEATGSIVAFTDDDAIPASSWVRALWEAHQAYGADCVGGKILLRWLQAPPAWLMQDVAQRELWGVLGHLDRGDEAIVASQTEETLLYGGNLSFRMSVFQELGAFRTDLGVQGVSSRLKGEDTEMVRRAFRAGKRIVYAPEALVYHKVPAQRMRKAYFRRWKFDAGRSLARASNASGGWMVREWLLSGAAWLRACSVLDGARDAREMMFWVRSGRLIGALEQRWTARRA